MGAEASALVSDSTTRGLERGAAATGSLADRVAALRAQLRAARPCTECSGDGQLAPTDHKLMKALLRCAPCGGTGHGDHHRWLQLAGFLGHPAARAVLGEDCSCGLRLAQDALPLGTSCLDEDVHTWLTELEAWSMHFGSGVFSDGRRSDLLTRVALAAARAALPRWADRQCPVCCGEEQFMPDRHPHNHRPDPYVSDHQQVLLYAAEALDRGLVDDGRVHGLVKHRRPRSRSDYTDSAIACAHRVGCPTFVALASFSLVIDEPLLEPQGVEAARRSVFGSVHVLSERAVRAAVANEVGEWVLKKAKETA